MKAKLLVFLRSINSLSPTIQDIVISSTRNNDFLLGVISRILETDLVKLKLDYENFDHNEYLKEEADRLRKVKEELLKLIEFNEVSTKILAALQHQVSKNL